MTLYSDTNLFFIKLFTILVPRSLHPPFAFFWGGLFYLLLGEKRRGVRDNLRTVTGQGKVERMVFSTFYKYARNWADVLLMLRLTGAGLESLIGRKSGGAYLEEALAKGNGAILITPHFGNWELGGLALAEREVRVNVMTFREPDEKVNEMRERVRSERGIGTIYVNRDDTSPLAIIEAVNALRRNEVVALLGERDGSSHTMDLDFFGKPTPIPVGAAYLALASGAPVIPVFIPMESGQYSTLMEEPVYFLGSHGNHGAAVREGTSRVLRMFEKYIRLYPDQWYNFFPYWQETTKQQEEA